MKKYTAPNMDIRVFNNTAQTSALVSNPPEDSYVEALRNGTYSGKKAQVNIDRMTEITKFAF